jgi:hypothetical protein
VNACNSDFAFIWSCHGCSQEGYEEVSVTHGVSVFSSIHLQRRGNMLQARRLWARLLMRSLNFFSIYLIHLISLWPWGHLSFLENVGGSTLTTLWPFMAF